MVHSPLPVDEARQRLHEIIRADDPFDEKVRAALELGTKCLDVDDGYFTRIDQETNHWEAIVTTDTADGQTPPELELDLTETYCRETISGETALALSDAPNQGWADDPAFQTRELHTYLGTPLVLNEEIYGTVCFVAEDPRSEPFSETETWFAEHLTRLLERELERDQVEAELTIQTNLATVLNRVLRHNLRNDMSVIRGYTEVMAQQLDDEPASETVLTHIDDLIELTQKARELEDVVSATSERQHVDIGSLVEDIVDTVDQKYPAASMSVDFGDEVQVSVLQNFDRAIEELVENAVKHSGEHPTVTVAIETIPNAVEIRISDDGPGLPENEAQVLTEGEETPLAHGTGLGLWLAYWIVTSHDGSIDPQVTENGTTMTVTIPRKPTVGLQQELTELTRSRDKYKASFNEAKDAMVFANDEGRYIDVNDSAADLFGMDEEELLGRTIADFAPQGFDFEEVWQRFTSSDGERGTFPLARPDGTERVVEYVATPNIVPGVHLSVFRDITDRVERERRFNAMFNQTYQFTGLLEPDGTVLEANDTVLEFANLDREDVVGKPFWEAEWWQGDDASQEKLRDAIERASRGEFVRYETEVEGSEETATIDFSIRPVTDEDDDVILLIPEGRDITERKERERELTGLKERYETLLEAAPDPVFVADGETKEIIETNEAAETLLGKPRGDIVGQSQSSLHPPDQITLYRQTFEEQVETGETRRRLPDGSPIQIVTGDGEAIPVEISVGTVELPDGPVIFGIFRDISEQIEREQ